MKLPMLMVAMMATIGLVHAAPQHAAAQSRGNAVLMAFHSPHCGPCREMTGVLQSLGNEGVPIRRVDATVETSLTRRHSITQTPTYLVMLGGRELTRLVGVQSADRLKHALSDDGTGPLQRTASQVASRSLPPTQPRTQLAPTGSSWGQTAAKPISRAAGGNEAMPSLDVADAIERAKSATVRLRVHDGHGYGVGTGTIIDTHGDEALVLTCGHLFRESAKEDRIEVDVFVGGQARTVEGTVVDYDAKNRDIAVVAIKPGVEVTPVEVAVKSPVEVGTVAFSFGCDRGKDPSRRDTRITGVDKYNQHLGASNYEIDGAPIDGRSGGGLFDQNGRLIGVCNAADYDNNTGIYAGAGEVRWQLDRINMATLYENVSSNSLASSNPRQPAPQRSMPSVAPESDYNEPFAQQFDSATRFEPSAEFNSSDTVNSAAREMIVIVRDPAGGQDRVVTIANPSHELMAAVEAGRRAIR